MVDAGWEKVKPNGKWGSITQNKTKQQKGLGGGAEDDRGKHEDSKDKDKEFPVKQMMYEQQQNNVWIDDNDDDYDNDDPSNLDPNEVYKDDEEMESATSGKRNDEKQQSNDEGPNPSNATVHNQVNQGRNGTEVFQNDYDICISSPIKNLNARKLDIAPTVIKMFGKLLQMDELMILPNDNEDPPLISSNDVPSEPSKFKNYYNNETIRGRGKEMAFKIKLRCIGINFYALKYGLLEWLISEKI